MMDKCGNFNRDKSKSDAGCYLVIGNVTGRSGVNLGLTQYKVVHKGKNGIHIVH